MWVMLTVQNPGRWRLDTWAAIGVKRSREERRQWCCAREKGECEGEREPEREEKEEREKERKAIPTGEWSCEQLGRRRVTVAMIDGSERTEIVI